MSAMDKVMLLNGLNQDAARMILTMVPERLDGTLDMLQDRRQEMTAVWALDDLIEGE